MLTLEHLIIWDGDKADIKKENTSSYNQHKMNRQLNAVITGNNRRVLMCIMSTVGRHYLQSRIKNILDER